MDAKADCLKAEAVPAKPENLARQDAGGLRREGIGESLKDSELQLEGSRGKKPVISQRDLKTGRLVT